MQTLTLLVCGGDGDAVVCGGGGGFGDGVVYGGDLL